MKLSIPPPSLQEPLLLGANSPPPAPTQFQSKVLQELMDRGLIFPSLDGELPSAFIRRGQVASLCEGHL